MDLSIESEEFQVNFIESLVDPHVPFSGKCERSRVSPTKIKAIYHLYQLTKNIQSGKWTSIYQGITRISKGALVSKRHLSQFVNNPDFDFFGSVEHRPGTTNIYRLNSWVLDLFSFFEKKGLMKHFRTDFKRWRVFFLRRINSWLIPLLQKKVTLREILMNKISTTKNLKGNDLKFLKGNGIKPSGANKALQGSISNTERLTIPASKDFDEIAQTLSLRFSLKEGDLNMVMNSFTLNHHKSALVVREKFRLNGIEARSPIRLYQHCLNITKRNKINYYN